jgi:hypothetical protein
MVKQGHHQQSYTRKSYFIYLFDNFNDILLNERGFHIRLLTFLKGWWEKTNISWNAFHEVDSKPQSFWPWKESRNNDTSMYIIKANSHTVLERNCLKLLSLALMVSSVIVQYTQRNKTCRTTCREIWTIHLVTGHILGMTVSSWI